MDPKEIAYPNNCETFETLDNIHALHIETFRYFFTNCSLVLIDEIMISLTRRYLVEMRRLLII